MTPGNERAFYDAVILICALMCLFNLGRSKSRGLSAMFLGSAFLVLGGTIYAYTLNQPTWVLGLGGTIVFLLLVADMVFRVNKERNQ